MVFGVEWTWPENGRTSGVVMQMTLGFLEDMVMPG